MARVARFEPGGQELRLHESEVTCFFQVIPSQVGPVLHLSTFGSTGRQSSPKSSQSIQLDRIAAHELFEVMRQAFPDERFE
jgi:hypothetical protein